MSRFPEFVLLRSALVTALVTLTGASRAETPTKFGEVAIVDAEPPAENLPQKRPVPDYDGRGEKPATTGDRLLWIPRILLAPLYFFTEYLVRRPIGAIVTAIERDKLAQRVIYIGTIGPKSNLGFFPSFYFDYGRVPSVGLYVWWDHVGLPRNYVRGYVATWGEPLLTATVADRYELDHAGTAASLRVSYTHRNDNLFYGLGPDTTSRTESRYESNTFEGGTVFEHRHLVAHTGFRDVRYGNDTCCGTPRLADVVKSGRLAPPPRFADGSYTALFQSATFAVDTRHELHESGARVSVTGAPSFDVSQHPGNSWVRYQASALGAWDMTGTSRTLSLGLNAMFVDPIQGGAAGIPFTELVTLGGTGPMRGYLPGRLIGRSAAVAALNYEWPVWSFIDGTIETSVGNVFDAGLKGFSADKLRLSTVFGIRSNASRDHVFELLSGFGTETFEHGARVTSFRLAVGASRAF
jgi:hypothetical protein